MKDAALNRVSTRTFENKPLLSEDIDKISSLISDFNGSKGPFDHSLYFEYVLNNQTGLRSERVGTYGLVRNAPLFVGAECENKFESLVDYGFLMQRLILLFTKEGFSTCWLGGTFKRKHFKKEVKANYIVPAITPVGYRAKSRSLVDKTVRGVAQSLKRYSMRDLFRNYDDTELTFTEDSAILQCLSLVRRGPSASNKQPWRAFIDSNIVHFYLKRTPKYPRINIGYDIQALDIGIALSSFIVGLNHYNKDYKFIKVNTPKNKEAMEYVLSVEIIN